MSKDPLSTAEPKNETVHKGDRISSETKEGTFKGEIISTEHKKVEDVYEKFGLSPEEWEPKSVRTSEWMGYAVIDKEIKLVELHSLKVELREISPSDKIPIRVTKGILEQIKKRSPKRKLKAPCSQKKPRRELEIDIMDPHFGLHCQRPAADHPWSIELAKKTTWWAIEDLINKAKVLGPFEQIVFPFGNDWIHVDNLRHTTTKGTEQPDSDNYHHIYTEAYNMLVEIVQTLSDIAPVKAYQIPGNHDYQTNFTIGVALDARFHNNDRVTIDASASPYKFHRFGESLIGFEHGHCIKGNRHIGLMANETRKTGWAETSYHEWHLGDQHRKATAKPSTFEEASVSVEYLSGLTPPNEYHRKHAYNFQKRGGNAFVRDYYEGNIGRFQCNIDPYTGEPLTQPPKSNVITKNTKS